MKISDLNSIDLEPDIPYDINNTNFSDALRINHDIWFNGKYIAFDCNVYRDYIYKEIGIV